MRALIVVRLSRVTDATTAPERQLETCRDLCTQRSYEVVGVAQDLDVSAGKTSPFDRPQLGDWLTNRLGEFDVLVVSRMDRIVRRLLDLADLIRWCQEHSVALVSASEAFLDLTAPFGDIIALLVAKVAEMELAAISERNRSAAQHNIRAGKYRGGVPPWGYLPDKSTGEWRLIPDPNQANVIREVVRRVLDDREPLRAVAHDLTERGIPTPRDVFAASRGRDLRGYGWSSGRLKASLTSPALLGYAMSGNEPVRVDGAPVVRAEPILTREEFDRVVAELSARENRKEPTKRTRALLLGVIFCGCGQKMYSLKGGKGRQYRYRCASAQYRAGCGGPSCVASAADRLVESTIVGLLGESERLSRRWDAGDDHSAELADVDAELADLAGQLGTPAFRPGTPQRQRLNDRINLLAQRQAELSRNVVRPAGWVWEPTGEKFGDWWAAQDVQGRNVWLREAGVRLVFDGGYQLDLGDLDTMTQQLNPAGAAAGWRQVFDKMTEAGIAGAEYLGDGKYRLTDRLGRVEVVDA